MWYIVALIVLGCLCGLTIVFFTLTIVCDNHLVPTIEVFIQQFQIPESLAAITLVAFGSATPELLLNSVSAIEKTSDVSLAAILGSAMIAFGLVPPLCLLTNSHKELKLKAWPVIRETVFYVLGLSVFLLVIADGVVTTIEAGMISSVYVVYVATAVTISYAFGGESNNNSTDHNNDNHRHDNRNNRSFNDVEGQQRNSPRLSSLPPASLPYSSNVNGYGNDNRDDIVEDIEAVAPRIDDTNAMQNLFLIFKRYLLDRIEHAVDFIVPALHVAPMVEKGMSGMMRNDSPEDVPLISGDSREEENGKARGACHEGEAEEREEKVDMSRVPLYRAVGSLMTCVVLIGLLATAIVNVCETLAHSLGIGGSTVGATLVSLGSEVPDMISSIALAKKGYNDGAMSGAIGSQVINISLGTGLPALFVCLAGDGAFLVGIEESESLWLLISLAFIVIVVHITMTLPVSNLLQGLQVDHAAITKNGATAQVCVWAFVFLSFVVLNETERHRLHSEEANPL